MRLSLLLGSCFIFGVCAADPVVPSAPESTQTSPATPSTPLALPRAKRAQAVPPPAQATAVADTKNPARFSSEEKWQLAGYNNDEVIYTIIITSHDTRIIRCNTKLQGSYYENGKKVGITDRQSTTVFPNQHVQAGNWMGMDQKSGATYSVTCRPV